MGRCYGALHDFGAPQGALFYATSPAIVPPFCLMSL